MSLHSDAVRQSEELAAPLPCDGQKGDGNDRRVDHVVADGEIGEGRKGHGDGAEKGAETDRRGIEQGQPDDDLDYAGEIAQPLAEPDCGEQLHHVGGAVELGQARAHEKERQSDAKCPENNVFPAIAVDGFCGSGRDGHDDTRGTFFLRG